jgi:hypothetical protein
MRRIPTVTAAVVLLACSAMPGAASEARRDGLRNGGSIEVSAARKHRKRSVSHVRSDRRPDNEPYAGYRTDFAGNPYFYYRPGGPFGPGRGLRAPYPN